MTIVKIKFKPSVHENKEGIIFYQIIHDKRVKNIKSRYKIYKNEWDIAASNIVASVDIMNKRAMHLFHVRDGARIDMRRLECIVRFYDNCGTYSVDDIMSAYQKQHKGQSLFDFMRDLVARLRELGKERTAETYLSTLSSFITFRMGEDLSFNMVNSDLLEAYEAFLRSREASLNTISFYMRKLRAVYNRAIDRGLISQQYPFKRVYTSIEKTPKRAISLKLIKKLKDLELMHKPDLEFVRDLFLFSFYTRGMSFVDVAYLRQKNLKNGVLTYMRRKTGQRIQIKWEKCMEELVSKHKNESIEYLLPIICNPSLCPRRQYITRLRKVNEDLKKIAYMAGIDCNLTTYVARHSWASAARTKNIPISVICDGMGHDSETTTQIYLASLDSAIINKANRLIINSI